MATAPPSALSEKECLPEPLPSASEPVSFDATFRRGLIAAALLSVLLRLRFVFAPINTDEGGFLAIARAWRHGKVLYTDVWVDRPQGLLVVYRLWDLFSGGNTALLRVIALVFGAAGVIAVAQLVRVLHTPAAGLVAGVLAAVLSSAPALEGFTANGELLGSAGSAVALGLGCAVLVGRLRSRWMVGAGIAAGVALSMKQSGVDGLAALVAWLLLAIATDCIPRRVAVARLGQLIAGTLAVVALLVVDAALRGWSAWWYAVNGYRTQQRSIFVGADWKRFDLTAHEALPLLVPVLGVAIVALGIELHRTRALKVSPVVAVLPIWLLTATASFLAGGQFFRHYWVILTFPLAALCGLAIGSVRLRWVRAAMVMVALVPALVSWWSIVSLPRAEIPAATGGNSRAVFAEHIGNWFRSHAAGGDSLYALCARADLYADAGTDPPYPYLWFDSVQKVPGAKAKLQQLLASPGRPTYVVEMQSPKACDSSGVVGAALDRYYDQIGTIDGIPILKVRAEPGS